MADKGKLVIYGSYGYTGNLIARIAHGEGRSPVLAGRNADKLKAQADAYGWETRAFDLADPRAAAEHLADAAAVLHCAGPFAHTYRGMAEACLASGTHYLDITGEITVFEGLAAMDGPAKEAGIMLMPGVGFDVVPSDCLAKHLAERLPDATELELAFTALRGGLSHGTATTMVENLGEGGAVRREGRITPVPLAYATRTIDFGFGTSGAKTCMSIPWGDVSTAYHSTGIPNITVYTPSPVPPALLKAMRPLTPLLGSGPVQGVLKRRIDRKLPQGPSDEVRATSSSLLWGRATNAKGESVESRLKTPEGYTLTAIAALMIADRVLGGEAPVGFQTPAKAYGKDLVLHVEGTERVDA